MKWRFVLLLGLSVSLGSCQNDDNASQSFSYLALGDSYTIGQSVEETERWPVQLASALNEQGIVVRKPRIIARTGWQVSQLKAGIEASTDLGKYNLVSLLIGVNNQFWGQPVEAFAPEFEEMLQIAIELANGDAQQVFVLSIPDYGKTPFGSSREEEIEREIDEYNAVCQATSARYGVSYFNITPISREAESNADLIASDNLHPSGLMYKRWVDLIQTDIAAKLSN